MKRFRIGAGARLIFVALAAATLLAGCHNYSYGRRLMLLRRKVRTSVPHSYEPITFDQMVDLEPSCPFDDSQGALIDRQESRAVTLEGYVIRVQQLAGGITYLHLFRRGDIHLEIGPDPDFGAVGDSSERVICEITKPFQWSHKHWNLEGLAPLVTLVRDDLIEHSYPGGTPGGTRVRISGYLLDDFVHCLAMGSTRATVWEIHPITKLEVWDEAKKQFVDLD